MSDERVFQVYDLESDGPPELLGEYIRTDEDVVEYRRPDGSVGIAPEDCVTVAVVAP